MLEQEDGRLQQVLPFFCRTCFLFSILGFLARSVSWFQDTEFKRFITACGFVTSQSFFNNFTIDTVFKRFITACGFVTVPTIKESGSMANCLSALLPRAVL